jgi:hypothetical protein
VKNVLKRSRPFVQLDPFAHALPAKRDRHLRGSPAFSPAWSAWLASVPFGNSPGPQSGACVSRKRVASLFCLRACHNTVQSVTVTVSSSIIILSERFAIESLQGISPSKACLMQESFGRLQHMRQVRICTAKSSSSVLRPRRYYAEATSLSTLFNRFTECPCGRQTSM